MRSATSQDVLLLVKGDPGELPPLLSVAAALSDLGINVELAGMHVGPSVIKHCRQYDITLTALISKRISNKLKKY